jgi:hypothetical protein
VVAARVVERPSGTAALAPQPLIEDRPVRLS